LNDQLILQQEQKIHQQLLQLEQAIRSQSQEEYLRALGVHFSHCDSHCRAKNLSWRESLLHFLKNFRQQLPQLLRARGNESKAMLKNLWIKSTNLSLPGMGEKFVHLADQMLRMTRQQGIRAMQFGSEKLGRYNRATATTVLLIAGATYVPWTVTTEIMESTVMGVFHVFCHASQLAYFAALAGVTKFVDASLKYLAYRPLQLTLVDRIFFARRMQRFYSAIGHSHQYQNNQYDIRLTEVNTAEDFYRQSRARVRSMEKEYALLSQKNYLHNLLGDISLGENLRRQYQYHRSLRELHEGLELLDFEWHLRGRLGAKDQDFLQALLQRAEQHLKSARAQSMPSPASCRMLFATGA